MSNFPIYAAAGATLCSAAFFVWQSFRLERQAQRLNRAREFYENTARELAVLDAGEKLPASRSYIMCAGCGANVQTEDDGFTPKWHKCFEPATVTPEGEALTPFIGDSIVPRYEGKKIPVGLKGHLHTIK